MCAAATLAFVIWGLFFGLARVSLLSRVPGHVGRLVNQMDDAFRVYRGKRPALVKAFLLSIALQGNVIMFYTLTAWSLNIDISLSQFCLITPLTIFVMMLPISINGVGLRENVLAVFLAWYDVGIAEAVAFAWLLYLGSLIFGMLGAILYSMRR